jgi:fused signal recognition particle receptor
MSDQPKSDAPKKKPGLFGLLFGGGPAPAAAKDTASAEPIAPVEPVDATHEERVAREPEPDIIDPVADVIETEPEQELEPPYEDTIVAAAPAPVPVPEAPKTTWFQRLKAGLTRTSSKLSEGITGLFTKRKLDGATLEDLEDLLIQSDLGLETSGRIIDQISKGRFDKGISADDVRSILSTEVARVLAPVAKPLDIDPSKKPHVVLVVGVNGSGKTTTIGKLAAQQKAAGRRVMLAAGDTFRAAAIDQLKVWGERTGCPVVASSVGADAAGLAFDALKQARDGGFDVLLMDTAGRLQNKQALMDELEKVVRVIRKLDATAPHDVLLVLDATTGQNALAQADVFGQRAGVTGLIMTKLDGTARGGILVAIAAKHAIPVHAIGVGEGIDDLQPFEADEFARAIANN